MAGIRIEDGVLQLEGRSSFLCTADYPYYRDLPVNWPGRLEKLRTLGHEVITCYIPWRHHELVVDGERRLDLSGHTQANRDVLGFLGLCGALGLLAIVKPGPFIHAETNYGGLPDFVCPLQRPDIEAMLDHTGRPVRWAGGALTPDGRGLEPWPLPAPLDPHFLADVERWFGAVGEQVLGPLAYPGGPIVMVQLGNEGIYSNGQHAPWAYDYSRSSLALYRAYLQTHYGDLATYNRLHGAHVASWEEIAPPREWSPPERAEDTLSYADWSAYQAEYMREIYQRLAAYIPTSLPYVINVNPPLPQTYGVDAWLSRVNPDAWPDVHYGFTNWIGAACNDRTVIDRYQILAKRGRGANFEENWGFSGIYGDAFAFDSVCFYQTLLAIASGATGYNIYTGVVTGHADQHLDHLHRQEYPESAPIGADGELTSKGQVASLLNQFFALYGAELLEARPAASVAWGLYLPYAHIAAWLRDDAARTAGQLRVPECGRALLHFERRMLDAHIGTGLVNLQAAPLSALQQYANIILAAGCFMDRATQSKLLAFVSGGGRLVIVGELPELDEEFRPCRILRNCEDSNGITVVPRARFYTGDLAGLERGQAVSSRSRALLWLYGHPMLDVQYLFVLTAREGHGPVDVSLALRAGVQRLRIRLPRSSGGVIRLADGRLSAALLKGINDQLGEREAPGCELGKCRLAADVPCDLLVVQSGDSYHVHIAGAGGPVAVRLPSGEMVQCL